MKKRIVSLFLAVLMVLSTSIVAVAADADLPIGAELRVALSGQTINKTSATATVSTATDAAFDFACTVDMTAVRTEANKYKELYAGTDLQAKLDEMKTTGEFTVTVVYDDMLDVPAVYTDDTKTMAGFADTAKAYYKETARTLVDNGDGTKTLTVKLATKDGGISVLELEADQALDNFTLTFEGVKANKFGSATVTGSMTGKSETSRGGSSKLVAAYASDPVSVTCTVRRPSSGGGVVADKPEEPITVPVTGDKDTIHVDATIKDNTATIKDIPKADFENVGTQKIVTIDMSRLPKKINSVVIPTETLKTIAESDAQGLEIILADSTVTIDKQTLKAVYEQAAGPDVQLVIDPNEIASKTLNAAQKEAVKDMKNATVIEAYFVSGGKRISDFRGGTAEVVVSYETTKPIRAWYLREDGVKERVAATYDKKNARLTLKHFSHYVIEELDESMAYISCPKDETCPIYPFTDSLASAWYHDGVHYCIDNGLMRGTDEKIFSPDAQITRGQIVTILWRLENSPATDSAMSFTDVPATAYYYDAIRWAASTKVVEGYDPETFGPDNPITREQLATILWRYAKYKGIDVSVGETTDLAKFVDLAQVSEYAVPAFRWAVGAGAVSGMTDTTLAPKGTATRAQAASLMQRYIVDVIGE